jgi:histidinol-phosphate aminotransferase
MTDTPVLDRGAAQRPTPKPGILDIAPYVPGKAKVDGIEHPLKLSANENILGSSEKAREAFASAIDQLHMYPEGRWSPSACCSAAARTRSSS